MGERLLLAYAADLPGLAHLTAATGIGWLTLLVMGHSDTFLEKTTTAGSNPLILLVSKLGSYIAV